MAVLPIITLPDPLLHKESLPVEAVDDSIRQLVDDMLETMYDAPGIGLAAVQVGVTKRIIVVDVAREEEEPNPIAMINPEITWADDEHLSKYEEGCLSVPGQYAEVARPERVRVKFLDRQGESQELDCEGLLATCVQHEIDHLNGVVFVDHLSNLKRNMILRKLRKAQASKSR